MLPCTDGEDQTVFFVEIQFQPDPHFYQRLFAEIFLFLRQNPQTVLWQAVVLFANRRVEPEEPAAFQTLLDSDQVRRIYLEDIQETVPPSLEIGLI